MAKGSNIRELLQALAKEDISVGGTDLRGPGVQGTGRELIVNKMEEIAPLADAGDEAATAAFDNLERILDEMDARLPPVSRRSFLKGLGALAIPSPGVEIAKGLADLPVAGVAKVAAKTVSKLPTTRIELMKPVWDIVDDLTSYRRNEILGEFPDMEQADVHGILSEEMSDLREEAMELGSDWGNYPYGGEGHLEMLDKVRDEVEILLRDAGMPYDEAIEYAKQIEDATWPEFQEYDSGNVTHAGAAFETELNAPPEVIEAINKAMEGIDLGDWMAAREAGRTVIGPPSKLPESFSPFKAMKEDELVDALPRYESGPDAGYVMRSLRQQDDETWHAWKERMRVWLEKNPRENWRANWYSESDPTTKALGGLVQKYAKGGTVAKIVNRDLEELRQYTRGRTVQPGMFSTLDELIKEAPFDVNSGDQWMKYLKPGRMLKREGTQFPLKKEELAWTNEFGDDEGLAHFVGSDENLTKAELRERIAANRQDFELSANREDYDEFGEQVFGQSDERALPERWLVNSERHAPELEDLRALLPPDHPLGRIHTSHPKYGGDYEFERLYHKSPGSTYEESVTHGRNVDFPSHFTPDTISWSRVSTHQKFDPTAEDPGRSIRVRLIEEIQSDLHSKAAEKIYHMADGNTLSQSQFEYQTKKTKGGSGKYSQEQLDKANVERIGYMDQDKEISIEQMEESLADMHESLGNDFRDWEPPEMEGLRELKRQYEMAPSNAPYKNPKDYAALEMRKQLLNAVENGDDYLALVRGQDQIDRYQAGMDERRSAGMITTYDKLYLSELEKLGKRYGAQLEDITVPVGSQFDTRPPGLVNMDLESYKELTEAMDDMLSGGGSKEDIYPVMGQLEEDIGYLHNRMSHDDYEATFKMDAERSKLSELTDEVDKMRSLFYSIYDQAGDEAVNGFTKNPSLIDPASYDPAKEIHIKAYQANIERLHEIGKELDDIYDAYSSAVLGPLKGEKSFPALKLTDEVKERVRKLGVPQYAKGGVVKKILEGLEKKGPQSEPWIGVLTKDGEYEFRNKAEGEEADWHHSFAMRDLKDEFDSDDALRFVRYGDDLEIQVAGEAALDPMGRGKAQLRELARLLKEHGVPSDYKVRVEDMRLGTDYEGEVVGTIDQLSRVKKALGGLVQRYADGGGVASATLGSFMRPVESEEEYEKVLAQLKESDYDRETSDLMGTLQYWKDTAKRIPATMSSMWKTLNERTGEAEWNFGHAPPPFELVEMGAMSLEDWLEYKKTAERLNEENPSRPGIIDDTISIAALPYAGANYFRDEENQLEIPQGIVDAMGRSSELMGTIEKDYELGEARGLPQHLATGLGVMLGQVPSPKSAAEVVFGGIGKVARPLTRQMPASLRKVSDVAVGMPFRAAAEFFDPTVNPSFKNYMIGTGFGAALGVAAEAMSDEKPKGFQEMQRIEALQEKQRENYLYSVGQYATEEWDNMPMETKMSIFSSENPDKEMQDTVWASLSQTQQLELLQIAADMETEEMMNAQ